MEKSLDYWRIYFGEANSDIYDIIENAVIVAALDYPNDFMLKRDHITELLFTCKCKLAKYDDTHGVELSVPRNGPDGETLLEGERIKNGDEFKVNCCGDGNGRNVSYEKAEALADQIEEESQLIKEVLRIKKLLDNHENESDITLLDSLRRLRLMDLSIEILKVTEIGKSVNGLRKQGSKQVRNLAQTLKEGWIAVLDSWMNATPPFTENTSSVSIKTSTNDFKEGLPCPPFDEGALFNQSMDLSDIFDGMDDDGNLMNHGDGNNNGGSGRKLPLKNWTVPEQKQQQLPKDLCAPLENNVRQTMKEETIMKKKAVIAKPIKLYRGVSGTRPATTSARQKVNNETEAQLKRVKMPFQKERLSPQDDVSHKHRAQQSDNGSKRTKPFPPQQEKLRSSDEAASIQMKMEASKRKLQERYQEVENAKKQRTIQVIDIPKQGARRNRLVKPGHSNHNRHWANGRK